MSIFLSHKEMKDLKVEMEEIKKRLEKEFQGDDLHLRLKTLNELNEFEFGQFLILNKGLNGYWTDYAVYQYPYYLKETEPIINKTMDFILNKSPTMLATQNRFKIFRNLLIKEMGNYKSFASLSCGLMGDLLDLDFKEVRDCKIVGIDLDKQSIELAKERAFKNNLGHMTSFICQDAWELDFENSFDVLTSNGLNLYVKEEKKAQALYDQFYKVLKNDGVLITSFLTPPPPSEKSEWKLNNKMVDDLKTQKMIYGDVLNVMWDSRPTTTQEMINSLKKSGFRKIEIFPDEYNIFPTVRGVK